MGVDKTLTMAATVACNLAGSTTVGLSGQMIKIASRVSGGWTSVMINRSALVTRPEDSSMGGDVDTVTSQGHRGPGSGANANRDRVMRIGRRFSRITG
jgi:hypothetical protein